MMNESNQISKQTTLFGYIGEHAGVSRFSAVLNKTFKSNSVDAMMIPMNIREDDLYFTVSNMKKSHVNGAVISSEYVDKVLEIVDKSSELSKRSGMCDIIYSKDDSLVGDIFGVRVLTEYLKDMNVSKVALIGVNPYAKAFSFLSCGFIISYFNENLEQLMEFTKELELNNADINRIADGMEIDFSSYDVVLDFSDMKNFNMVKKLGLINLDMKNIKQISALKTRAHELDAKYVGYDDMIEELSVQAYNLIRQDKR